MKYFYFILAALVTQTASPAALFDDISAFYRKSIEHQFFDCLTSGNPDKAEWLAKKHPKIIDPLTYTKGLVVITQPNAPRTPISTMICFYLLERKANPNCGALHNAGKYGHPQLCAPLVNARAMVDLRDLKRKTPLMYAVENRHAPTVTTLLMLGADPDQLMPDDRTTPLAYAFNELNHLRYTLRADRTPEHRMMKQILDKLVAAKARLDLEDPLVIIVEDDSEESESSTRSSVCYDPTPYSLTPSRLQREQTPAPQ